MGDERPYSETYYAQLAQLYEAQKNAAQWYTGQMLSREQETQARDDTVQQRAAEEAAQEWLRLDAEIASLNAAECAKRRRGQGARNSRDTEYSAHGRYLHSPDQ